MDLFEVHNFKCDASNKIKQVRRAWTLTAQDEGNCSISAKQVNYCRKGEELIVINKTDLKNYRRNSKFYLKNNPNFFDNLSGTFPEMKKVVELKGNTNYKELGCVSFNPKTNELKAAVSIKKQSGYSGNSCSKGSMEYLRFFVDYERDGTWVDEGVTHFNTHDLKFEEELCYGVKLTVKG